MNPSNHWRRQARSAEEVASLVPSGARVFVHGAAATPTPLLDALSARNDLDDVTLYHLHLAGPCAFVDRPTPGVTSHSLFTGAALRRPVEEGRAEFIPVFLSDIPALFASGSIRSTSRCCSSRRLMRTATARSERRSTAPRRPRTRRGSSWPKSTTACRGRTATASCPSIV